MDVILDFCQLSPQIQLKASQKASKQRLSLGHFVKLLFLTVKRLFLNENG